MTTKTKQLKLGAFLPCHHVAAWQHPQAQADRGLSFQPTPYTEWH
ncbi:MAG: hypothetical protein RMX96_19560 [Nostoc sp. ChiSLP02]|nr:hypothetical protein [Nostoc sp. DedSLP05]MDZ8097442.1 hypothetical protein [Nostoc sp. DedSLP01]MDZ8187030.1 hypothetical protein [Nostoc sp. ChiSLP02]